jgi:adenosylhomocysteine nucleosidase
MTRLGIVAALADEVRVLTKKTVSAGSVEPLNDNVLVTLSGIGSQRAQAAARALLDHGANTLLSFGSAAALDPGLAPGSLLLPKTVIADDRSQIPVDRDWHERLRARLSSSFATHTGALVESPAVLLSPKDKRELFERSGAIAADMESAAIGRVAFAAHIPFVTIRAIVDSADMAVPLELIAAIDPVGRIRLRSAISLPPREWPSTVRLAWGWRAARATLAGVLSRASDGLLVDADLSFH